MKKPEQLPIRPAEMDEHGPECDEYEAGCYTCEAWKLYRATGAVPSYEDVRSALFRLRRTVKL